MNSSNKKNLFSPLGYVMVARMGGDKPYPQGVASMQSPVVDIATEHCMSFRYFIRSNLTIVSRAKNEFTGDVLFQVEHLRDVFTCSEIQPIILTNKNFGLLDSKPIFTEIISFNIL